MAKLDIDFILVDESVVMNGFRCLIGGAKLAGFQKNPVMLLMHNRASAGMMQAADNDVMLPIGKWYDIRVIEGQLLAKPDFDDNDEFAKKIESKVKGGYLKGASIWLEPIAVSDDKKMALAGQSGPTITEWGVLEASIVDIPNCRNSLAIRNSAGAKITLSGTTTDAAVLDYLKTLTQISKNIMDKNLLCAQLGLAADASDAQISEALLALKNASQTGVQLTAENGRFKNELVRLKAEMEADKITALVEGAIAATKLFAGDKEKFLKLAKADFETTKELIDSMPARTTIESQLKVGGTDSAVELESLVKLSGHELYMAGKLDRLKELSMDYFKLKYKEALGVEFTA